MIAYLNASFAPQLVLGEPAPAPLGTLDALHLSTAIAWRDARNAELTMATHDKALATAARAVGLPVIGA